LLNVLILVLYSNVARLWKISDFGFTVEGTSKRTRDTEYARGTSCYRAPEIVVNRVYNNKVDIWAIGCILFEVLYRRKAFQTDFHVMRRASRDDDLSFPLSKKIGLTGADDNIVQQLISEMLDNDPSRRPRAQDLPARFRSALANSGKIGEFEQEFTHTSEIDMQLILMKVLPPFLMCTIYVSLIGIDLVMQLKYSVSSYAYLGVNTYSLFCLIAAFYLSQSFPRRFQPFLTMAGNSIFSPFAAAHVVGQSIVLAFVTALAEPVGSCSNESYVDRITKGWAIKSHLPTVCRLIQTQVALQWIGIDNFVIFDIRLGS
jgi:serine/threonine protein kinase